RGRRVTLGMGFGLSGELRPSAARFRSLPFTGPASGNEPIPEILKVKRFASSQYFVSRAHDGPTRPDRPVSSSLSEGPNKHGTVLFVTVRPDGLGERTHSRNTEFKRRCVIAMSCFSRAGGGRGAGPAISRTAPCPVDPHSRTG